MQQKPRGRQFFANPGPTNIPDSILHAIAHPTVDFRGAEFLELYESCLAGLQRVLKTRQHVFMYTASGHGAWEATLSNLCSPGDRLLMLESGYFSDGWTDMAQKLGLVVETLHADRRRGVDVRALRERLEKDTEHRLHAVCAVHNETSTGVAQPIPAVRAALDAAHHPALLLADVISSLAAFDVRMDEWGVDGIVGGSQKGLMLPAGFSFTGVSQKAMAAHAKASLPRYYFDWTEMLNNPFRGFCGTVPINLFYGFKESLRLLEEEGLEQVFARHHRLAEGVRRAVGAWSGNAGPENYCADPTRCSDSVTTVLLPDSADAEAVRQTALQRFNVCLGSGLGPQLRGKAFRIAHLGDLNEPMVLGVLGAVEMSFRLEHVPYSTGGVDAAMDWFSGSP